MKRAAAPDQIPDRLTVWRLPPGRHVPTLADDAARGLLVAPRSLPPKYFYDGRGSLLFDRICETPEYYPTRTEAALLERHAGDVIASVRPACILELGAGMARKTRHLFDACERLGCYAAYWPFDVCEQALSEAGGALTAEYPWLRVRALVGDYSAGLDGLPSPPCPRLYTFLGGTVGNFTPAEGERFLREIRCRMATADRLLLGADRVKDPAVLHAAYNDADGVTAEFNRNVLRVLNRGLDADFDPAGFAHEALYNPDEQQIEINLVALREQSVRLGALGCRIRLAAGERVRTEISRKFTVDSLAGLLASAGLGIEQHFTPPNEYFSLVLARPI
jgi:L-histidine Nalpha-methyltransferase